MAKILVTGGAGYIGSILVPMFLQSGHEVVVLDNFMYEQTSLLECVSNPALAVIRGDARDADTVFRCLQGVHGIIPLAAIVGAPSCDKDRLLAETTNFEAIRMLLQLKRFEQWVIYPNTNSGYGLGQESKLCDEKTPLRPISLYGRTKVQAEKIVMESYNAIAFRLATVFGVSPRMRTDLMVNDFVRRALFDRFIVLFEARVRRNFVHVSDVARAFIFAVRNFNRMKNEVYNLGLAEANMSKWELCEEIKKQLPSFYFSEAPVGEDPDKRDYIVSNSKLETAGFRATTSLATGIAELIRSYAVLGNNLLGNV